MLGLSTQIYIALDTPTLDEAGRIIRLTKSYVDGYKIGLELQTNVGGPQAIEYVARKAERRAIFYDGKFNDTPRTVSRAVKALTKSHVDIFTIHASAGPQSIRAAVENKGESRVFGVSVLTSLSEEDSMLIFGSWSKNKVAKFAQMLAGEGADGIVCGPREARAVKDLDLGLTIAVPAIQPVSLEEANMYKGQSRSGLAYVAVRGGAHILVVGRGVTESRDPVKAINKLREEVGFAEE